LNWNDNTESDLAGYRVYRSTTAGVVRNTANRIASVGLTSAYRDGSAANNQRYYYVVTAIDAAGNESPASNEIAVDTPAGNALPSVTLTAPLAGATFTAPATISLSATATDSDGTIAKVAFYQGTTLLGEVTSSPYAWTWSGVSAGNYSLTAQATDNRGALGLSTAVGISVVAPGDGYRRLFSSLTPSNPNATDNVAYELGTKFRTSQAGVVTALRYYQASSESGAHVGRLWSSTGSLLASATFPASTGAGWKEVRLATPVRLAVDTTYVVSVNANSHYAFTQGGLASSVAAPPLSTIADGANGVFGTAGTFPTQSWNTSNYFRDVVFLPDGTSYNYTRWLYETELAANDQASTADPDGDAQNNTLEYAVGTAPRAFGPSASSLSTVVDAGQSYLALTFRRRTDARDVTYTVQASDDLVRWSSGPVLFGSATPDGAGFERVTYRDTVPRTSSAPRRFMRLSVELAP
jgi:hypothetical protein